MLFDKGSKMAKKKKWYVFIYKDAWGKYSQFDLQFDIGKEWDKYYSFSKGKFGEQHPSFVTREEAISFIEKLSLFNREEIESILTKNKTENKNEITKDSKQEIVMAKAMKVAECIAKHNDIDMEDYCLKIEENTYNEKHSESNQIGVVKFCTQDCINVEEKVNDFCKHYGFNNFSDEQKKAIQTVDGQSLLFAIPGSGKTTVIIARTGYMIYKLGISPHEIISITFTKAAAKEMRDRFIEKFSGNKMPDFRTIHSLCYSIILLLEKRGYIKPKFLLGSRVKINGNKSNEIKKAVTAKDVFRELSKKVIANTKLSNNEFEMFMECAQSVISAIKNKQMQEEEYRFCSVRVRDKVISCQAIYDNYQEILNQHDCMDFDDLLVCSYKELSKAENKSVIDSLRIKYKYWNVDEAQDNSKIQYELLKLICGKTSNLFMVGDDDQSIYSFRGASPQLLLDYAKQPSTTSLFMSTNYRSDRLIVNAAKQFIEENKSREFKEMAACSKRLGKIVIPKAFCNEGLQYSYIVNAAKDAVKNGTTLAVLFRRNISSLPIIAYMFHNNISYESSKGLAEILQTKDIQIIWKFLCFACDMKNVIKFKSIWKYLKLYSDDIEDYLKSKFEQNLSDDVLSVCKNILQSISCDNEKKRKKNESLIKRFNEIENIITQLKKLKPSEAIIYINKEFNWVDLYGIGARLRFYSLLSAADLFNTTPEFVDALNRIIKSEKKRTDNNLSQNEFDELDDESEMVFSDKEDPLVTLSTIHSAKGREFSRVIIIDALEDIMPGKIYEDALIKDFEEERRLFYVAVTRAAHELDLLTVEKYHGNEEIISSFIKEFELLCGEHDNIIIGCEEDNNEEVSSVDYLIQNNKYYAVKVGRKPGIYTDWESCNKQIKGFPNQDCERFDTREEAEKYLGIVHEKLDKLNYGRIDEHLVQTERVVFNKPMNLPDVITKTVYKRLRVNKIADLDKPYLEQLRTIAKRLFEGNSVADYGCAAEAYLLAYMPVNFYKVWKPLRELAQCGKLPTSCDVLELGAGPGTSTMGLLTFYGKLAAGNRNRTFRVDIIAVERERKFKEIFNELIGELKKVLPSNLTVVVQFVNEDVFHNCSVYNRKYDLIMESNMFNLAEAINNAQVNDYVDILTRVMKPETLLIMIEPADQKSIAFFERISEKIQKEIFNLNELKPVKTSASDVSGIKLFSDAYKNGIRFKYQAYHWFSYKTFFKSEEVQL